MLAHHCPDCSSRFASAEELNTHKTWRHAPKGTRQAIKRVRRRLGLEVSREPVPTFAWPGGYPIYYVCADSGVLCPACVNREVTLIDTAQKEPRTDKQWEVIGFDTHDEGDPLTCDHCNAQIESAYGPVGEDS